jgi:hypothetical protein
MKHTKQRSGPKDDFPAHWNIRRIANDINKLNWIASGRSSEALAIHVRDIKLQGELFLKKMSAAGHDMHLAAPLEQIHDTKADAVNQLASLGQPLVEICLSHAGKHPSHDFLGDIDLIQKDTLMAQVVRLNAQCDKVLSQLPPLPQAGRSR